MKRPAAGAYLRIAHRGAAALAPENTIASLAAALEHEVDLVEFDVVGQTDSLTLAHSPVDITPASPSLDDALAFLVSKAAPEVGFVVDLKSVGYEEAVVNALRRHGALERAIVSSFSAAALRALHRLEAALEIGLSYPHDRFGIAERPAYRHLIRGGAAAVKRTLPARIGGMLARSQANVALVSYLVLSPRLVERCHGLGVPVLAWTIEDAALLEQVVATGVDGVVANDPRIFAV